MRKKVVKKTNKPVLVRFKKGGMVKPKYNLAGTHLNPIAPITPTVTGALQRPVAGDPLAYMKSAEQAPLKAPGAGAGLTQGGIAAGAGLASGLISAIDTKGSNAGAAASGALSGAASGMALGPIGAAAGAVIGGVTGFLGNNAQKKAEEEEQRKQMMAQQKQMLDYSNSLANPNVATFQRGGTVKETEEQRRRRLAAQSRNAALLLPKLQNGGTIDPRLSDAARRLYEYQSQPGFNPMTSDTRELFDGDPYIRENAQALSNTYAQEYPDAKHSFNYERTGGQGQSYGFVPPLTPINRDLKAPRQDTLVPMNITERPLPELPETKPDPIMNQTWQPKKTRGATQSSKTGWYGTNVPEYKFGGNHFDYKSYEMGGYPEVGNAEIEGEEVVQTPQGDVTTYAGPAHEQGGIDVTLPQGSRIYSEELKDMDGVSYAEKADSVRRKMKRFEAIDSDQRATKLAKMTAKLMLNKMNKELDSIFTEQEQYKQMNGMEGDQQMFRRGGTTGDNRFEPKRPVIHKAAYNQALFTPDKFRVERRKAPDNYDGPGEYMYVLVAKDSHNSKGVKSQGNPAYMLIDEDSYNQFKANNPEMVFDRDVRMPASYNKRQWAYTDKDFIDKAFGRGTEKAAMATASFQNPTFEATGATRPQTVEANLASTDRTLRQNEQVNNYNTGQQLINNTRNMELAKMRSYNEFDPTNAMGELEDETMQSVDMRAEPAGNIIPSRTGLVQPTQSPLKVEKTEGSKGPFHAIHGSYETDEQAQVALKQIQKDFPNAKIVKTNIGWNGISIGEYATREEGFAAVRQFKDEIKAGKHPNTSWNEDPTFQTWLKNIRPEDMDVALSADITADDINRMSRKKMGIDSMTQPAGDIYDRGPGGQPQDPVAQSANVLRAPEDFQGTTPESMQQAQQQDPSQIQREAPLSLIPNRETLPRSQVQHFPRFGIDARYKGGRPYQQYDPNEQLGIPEQEFTYDDEEQQAQAQQPQGAKPKPGDIDPRTGMPFTMGDLIEYSPTIYNAIKALGARGRARRIDKDFDPGQYMASGMVEPRRTSLDPIRRELEAHERSTNRMMRNTGADASGSIYNRMMGNAGMTRRGLADVSMKEDQAYTQNKLQADMFNVETDKFNRQMRFQGDAARRQAHAMNEAFLPKALTGASAIAGQRRREANQMSMEMMKYGTLPAYSDTYNVYEQGMNILQPGQKATMNNPYAGDNSWLNRPLFGDGSRRAARRAARNANNNTGG